MMTNERTDVTSTSDTADGHLAQYKVGLLSWAYLTFLVMLTLVGSYGDLASSPLPVRVLMPLSLTVLVLLGLDFPYSNWSSISRELREVGRALGDTWMQIGKLTPAVFQALRRAWQEFKSTPAVSWFFNSLTVPKLWLVLMFVTGLCGVTSLCVFIVTSMAAITSSPMTLYTYYQSDSIWYPSWILPTWLYSGVIALVLLPTAWACLAVAASHWPKDE